MVYIKRSDGAYFAFDGLRQDDIVALVAAQGFTCEFISDITFSVTPVNNG
jgi:hypothetical protein